jgi:hypothetical protein
MKVREAFLTEVKVWSDTKSSLLLDFRRGAQRVPPVCFGVLFGANRNGEEQAALSPHGRDGHALFLRFKV